MADNDVTVRFGAAIEGLVAGVTAAKEQIEGLRAPVDSFIGGLGANRRGRRRCRVAAL
jgi:hypothetical protein